MFSHYASPIYDFESNQFGGQKMHVIKGGVDGIKSEHCLKHFFKFYT